MRSVMRTFAEMLERGRQVIEEEERTLAERREEERELARARWVSALVAAAEIAGPLAEFMVTDMPDGYSEFADTCVLFRPFDCPVTVGVHLHHSSNQWHPHHYPRGRGGNCPFVTWRDPEVRFGSDDYYVCPNTDYFTSLEVALAYAERAAKRWPELNAECERKNAERKARLAEKALAQNHMPTPAQQLEAALTSFIHFTMADVDRDDY